MRVGSVVVALGLIGALALRIDNLHTLRLGSATIHSPLVAEEFRLLMLVNDERNRAGLAPLQFSPRLLSAARAHSLDMAAHGYLGHDSPAGDTPSDRARAAGLNYDELGENLYSENLPDATSLPERVMATWMQNPAHRANLLSSSYRVSAVGMVHAADGNYYVTEDFIR
ncbi:MAG TPA: CAP domain-containing protein [Candidatus Binataceae bacterium]|nr:CAP domain-containing protein [Candidatus Binataceae bacterium]